ncbi:Protein broad-minded [Trinorchestia longiramus]|nr:Protein broad-minded [Trinorchestia longiramus]
MNSIQNQQGRLGYDRAQDDDADDSAGYESDSDTASDSTLRDNRSSSETDSHRLSEDMNGKTPQYTQRDPGLLSQATASEESDLGFKVDNRRRNSRIKEETGCVKHLKDLLIRLSPMISLAGTSDNTAEMLMFLSDTDPNFHTLQLVKAMRQGARNALEPAVDQLVHQYLETAGDKIKQENPVVAVLNNLFQNESFISYMEDFQNTLLNSSNYLHQNFEGEMTSVMHEFYLNSNKNWDYIQDYSSTASSLNSSLNQSGFLFLSSVQYERIASTLTNKQLIAEWSECLNQLLSVTPGEPVLQQSWFDIKKGLKSCLLTPMVIEHSDQNDIFDKSLKMHSKLLASQTQQAITEANLNLIEAASEFWLSKKLSSFISTKSNMKLVQCSPVLRIVRLLLYFQADLSLLWVRYPQHLTMLLIERWLDFLVGISGRGGGGCLSSCDMVSILDPEATWLKHWLYPRYGRSMVLAAVTRSPVLISDALKVCMNFINGDSSQVNKDTHRREFSGLSEKELETIKFVYSVCTIFEFLRYEEGRQLFPISISTEDEPITVSSFLTTIFTFNGRTNLQKLSNCVRRKLKEICASSEQVVRLLCKVGIIEHFAEELKTKRHVMDRDSLSIVLGILQVILSTAKGLRYISQGSVEKTIRLTHNELCNDLLNLFGRLLVEEHQLSVNYALVFEMSTTLLKCEVGRFLYAGHQTFRQTLTNLTSLYHRSLLGVLEAVANGSIVVEHRQSLLRQTAAAALSKALQEPSSQPWEPPPSISWQESEQSAVEQDHVSTLPAHVIAILISTPHGAAALLSVVEEDPSLLWLQSSLLQLPLALLALASHTAGVEMILEQGVRHLAGALFSWQKLDEREAGLELVAAAGGVLDSRLLLQDKLGYREELSRQLTEEYSEGPVLDESYVLRAHLLQRAAHLSTEHRQLYVLPPHRNTMLDEVQQQESGVGPGNTRRNLLQQSGLWHFLQNTRMSVHDHTWLRHCRRHFQAALIASDNIKNSQVFSMLEWALEALGSEDSPDEAQYQHASPSPESSPRPHEVAQLQEALAHNVAHSDSQTGSVTEAAIELARRYSSQLEMVTAGRWSSEKLQHLLTEVRHDVAADHRSTDWFTILLYILADANFERTRSALARLVASPPGRALWPLLGSSTLVVKLAKLLLSQYQPATFNALQMYSCGCIWNLVKGWMEGCWLGMMSWAEVCNWTAAVVLLGPDYAVYITVAVLKHRLRQLYKTLNQLSTPKDRLIFFQVCEGSSCLQQSLVHLCTTLQLVAAQRAAAELL